MHAHTPRPHLGGNGGYGRGSGIGQQRAGLHAAILPNGGQEAFTGCSYQEGEFAAEELRQGLEQRPIILRGFGKAQARIEHDIIAAHAGVAHKALAEVGGATLLARVAGALRAAGAAVLFDDMRQLPELVRRDIIAAIAD